MTTYKLILETNTNENLTNVETAIYKLREDYLVGKSRESNLVYDILMNHLERTYKESPLLENDIPIKIITTEEELLEEINEETEIYYYLNPQGVHVELTYEHGALTDAQGYGRTFLNRNLLEECKEVLGERNDFLEDFTKIKLKVVLLINNQNAHELKHKKKIRQSDNLITKLIYNKEDLEYIEVLVEDMSIPDYGELTLEEKQKIAKEYYLETPYTKKSEADTENLAETIIYELKVESEVNYPTNGIRILHPNKVIIYNPESNGNYGMVKNLNYAVENENIIFNYEIDKEIEPLKLTIDKVIQKNISVGDIVRYFKLDNKPYLE